MKTRRLGKSDIEVSAIGLGCMSLTPFYGVPDDAESITTLRRAAELGVSFFDSSIFYGNGRNEEIIAEALGGMRDQITLATKCGVYIKHTGGSGYLGHPEYIRQCCDASLYRLKTDVIDLWYMHRLDPDTPVEESVGAMGRCVEAGKVRAIGVCEVKPETLRRAHATYPITVLQSEYSLWTRDPEGELLDTCRELGISLIAYSPLGRGFLTGAIKSQTDLYDDDRRTIFPRFSEENLNRNQTLLDTIREIASAKGCTPGQITLAWVLAQGDDIVPIPGTRRVAHIEENVGAADVQLGESDLAALDQAFPKDAASGDRVPEIQIPYINQ
tara:strand:+ start:522 stop:1505 length:984 start_codon:yes stop_codon:yes gene_type:complete